MTDNGYSVKYKMLYTVFYGEGKATINLPVGSCQSVNLREKPDTAE